MNKNEGINNTLLKLVITIPNRETLLKIQIHDKILVDSIRLG